MNPTLIFHTAMQRAFSPPRVLLVFSVATFPVLLLSFAPLVGLQALQSGPILGMILGAGLIGQDVSSGVLQLLFSRPVSRAEYVLSRWFAAGACAAAIAVLEIALGAGVMAMRGQAAPVGAVATLALEQVLAAFGVVSVLALFSSVLPGIGDILAWIVLNVAGGVLQMAGAFMQAPWLLRASSEWSGFLSPALHFQDAVGGGVVSWFHLTSYFSTVTLCLALAIAILNRRELSYATD